MKSLSQVVAVVAAVGVFASCQQPAKQHAAMTMTTTAPANGNVAVHTGAASTLSPSDFHDALMQMDKSHHDKMKLSWYVLSPLRSVDPAFKPYYQDMQRSQKELAAELETWAKAHHLDLTFHYDPGVFGTAEKTMEDRQSTVAQADAKADFERDMLINMHMDYEFQISLLKTVIPAVHDVTLLQYLQKNLHNAEAATQQTNLLLKRFKFQ